MSDVTLCRGPAMEKVRDELDGDRRWCFTCRKVREFRFIVTAPTEPSYYGPNPSIRCAVCDTQDGDVFPGGCREWEGV